MDAGSCHIHTLARLRDFFIAIFSYKQCQKAFETSAKEWQEPA